MYRDITQSIVLLSYREEGGSLPPLVNAVNMNIGEMGLKVKCFECPENPCLNLIITSGKMFVHQPLEVKHFQTLEAATNGFYRNFFSFFFF